MSLEDKNLHISLKCKLYRFNFISQKIVSPQKLFDRLIVNGLNVLNN